MQSYWQNRSAVVTGGRGMVGSWLVDFLVNAGAKVTVMDTGIRGKGYNPYAHYVDVRQADCTSPGNCEAVFHDKDIVFNLVGHVGGIYHNLSHQAEQFWGNVQLVTAPVLAAVQAHVPVFLQVSTVCVYSEDYNNPAKEEYGHLREPEKSNAGYSWAKRMGERVCEWAFANTDTRYVIVRPTNVYGTRDYFDDKPHVIPALIKKFLSGVDPVPVYGGNQIREFIYDQDVARGMMVVAESGKNSEVYNLGTNGETVVTIAELSEMIRSLSYSSATIEYVKHVPTGDEHRSTDSTKAHLLGWKHQVSLLEGLDRTIKVYSGSKR